MRIGIISSPKAGNHWVKCLLGEVYELEWLRGGDKSISRGGRQGFIRWAASGNVPDDTVFHQHLKYQPAIADALERGGVHVVTAVRDPYDLFVSLYHWVQQRSIRGLGGAKVRKRDTLRGRPLDHPDVYAYLAIDFGEVLERSLSWMRSGRATVVRYEDLHQDPLGALRQVTDALAPVTASRLEAAIAGCRAEVMRARSAKLAWHVRSATTGAGAQVLTPAHLAVMRDNLTPTIEALGYAVR